MRWNVGSTDSQAVTELAAAAQVPEILARLLVMRGVATPEAARQMLHPSLEDLHSPFAMLGMAAAVERLQRGIAQKERILIYGDYDVDGTVAIVILKTCI